MHAAAQVVLAVTAANRLPSAPPAPGYQRLELIRYFFTVRVLWL